MRKTLRSKVAPSVWLALSSVLLISLLSCAGPQSHRIHLRLEPAQTYAPSSSVTFGLVPFHDPRTSTRTLGKRVRRDGTEEPILVDEPSLSAVLTRIMRQYLRARGFRVVDLDSWRPDPEVLNQIPKEVQVAIAGRIDAMEVEANSSLWKTIVRYRVRLTAHLGLKEKKEVLTRSVEISPKETYLRFDPQKIEDRLNMALKEALDHLLKGIPPPDAPTR